MTKSEISRLFIYTEWANHAVLKACESLNEEQLHRDFHTGQHSVLETLVHLLGAEWIWLERWEGKKFTHFGSLTAPYKMEGASIPAVAGAWNELEVERRRFMETLRDESLVSTVKYKNSRGEEFQQPLLDLMLHLVNHATHHRGQIIGFLRALGMKPPTTDLIHYFRTVE